MNRQWRGIGSYLMFFAVICMVLMFFESQMQGKAMYTYEQYEQAVDNADITSATITPNQETPTGTVTYTLKDGSVKTTNILNTEDEEETLKANLIKELRLLGAAYEQELLNQSGACLQDKRPTGIEGFGTAHRAENHVTSNMRQEIDLYAYYRVVAKIAFNCLAEVRGREYVMQQKFDPVREAILTGKDIEQMVMMPGKENSHADVLNKLENAKGFGVWRHMICITRIPNGMVAEVMLYGDATPMFVVLSKEDCRDFGEMDGYVCDWENRREMRFLEYIGEITREDREPYEWE